MFIVLAFLFIAEWFAVIVLVVLFGALGFLEMARTDRSPRKRKPPSQDLPNLDAARWYPPIGKRKPPSRDLPSPDEARWYPPIGEREPPSQDLPRPHAAQWCPATGKRGHTSPDSPSPRMIRWHIIAATLVIGSALMFSFVFACNVATSDGCLTEFGGPLELLSFALLELFLWFMALPALYGPMYAVRLHRHRVRTPELIGLGVCLLPVSLLAITSFELGFDPNQCSRSE